MGEPTMDEDLRVALCAAADAAEESSHWSAPFLRNTLKNEMHSQSPLGVHVGNGLLLIVVGVETLAEASEQVFTQWSDGVGEYVLTQKVINAEQFAKDVASELQVEDEVGTTDLHRLFDGAMANAVNNGSDAVEDVTPSRRRRRQ